MAKKMTRNQAVKRVDEARSKLLRVMRECSDLSPNDSTAVFKLSNDLHRMAVKIKRG